MPRRPKNQLRPIVVASHYLEHPEGSVLISAGDTRVICTASIDDRVPGWMKGKGTGWVTAEYDMLPRATHTRRDRDSKKGRINGRTQEISRLIGRSLRAVTDLSALGERMISVDCDVIQADGGTRTASITGAFIALSIALNQLGQHMPAMKRVIKNHIAAISVGIIDGEPTLDLDYELDSNAQVDMNLVMTGDGMLAEIQGTAEGNPFSRKQLDQMIDLGFGALPKLIDIQTRAIAAPIGAEPVSL